jgi:hypothetical protein
MLEKIKYTLHQAPAKWVALLQAVVALIAFYVDNFPQAAVIALITSVTGLGFVAQKVEDTKTYEAFLVDPNIEK